MMTEPDRRSGPRTVSDEPEFQRSSAEVKTSTRGYDIQVKSYVGSPVMPACQEALEAYWWLFDRMAAELMGRRGSAA